MQLLLVRKDIVNKAAAYIYSFYMRNIIEISVVVSTVTLDVPMSGNFVQSTVRTYIVYRVHEGHKAMKLLLHHLIVAACCYHHLLSIHSLLLYRSRYYHHLQIVWKSSSSSSPTSSLSCSIHNQRDSSSISDDDRINEYNSLFDILDDGDHRFIPPRPTINRFGRVEYHKRTHGMSDFDMMQTNYCPSVGLESSIVSMGNSRVLIQSDYEVAFRLFPNLTIAVIHGLWPDHELLKKEDIEYITSMAINASDHRLLPTQEDVHFELLKFRKVVLGLDKYRINNPGNVASKYSTMLKICMSVSDSWGYAANAVEYAGLIIADHIVANHSISYTDVRKGDENGNGIVHVTAVALNLTSLWSDALIRLLDLESQQVGSLSSGGGGGGGDSSRSDLTSTWDQRYFTQMSVTSKDIRAMKDMLISLARLAMRAVFSRPTNKKVFVLYPVGKLRVNGINYDAFKPDELSFYLMLQSEFRSIKEFDVSVLDDCRGIDDYCINYLVSVPQWLKD